LTPVEIGAALRAAREGSGVPMAEVHDRIGTPWTQLEALEAGDLSRFPDQRSALAAVRRYADLMGLDAEGFSKVVQDHWSHSITASVSATLVNGATNGGRSYAQANSAPLGHLSRYPGDTSHLRAFTQTAQVPSAVGVASGQENGQSAAAYVDATGTFPAVTSWHTTVRPAPLPLRMAVWLTAVIVVVGLAGLAVHRWHSQWLVDIHVMHPRSGGGPATTTGSTAGQNATPSGAAAHRTAVVTQTSADASSASIAVRAASYSVLVAASQRCWVQVDTPQSYSPAYDQVLQAGQSQTFPASNGQMTVHLGSTYALVDVQVNGKTAPGWLFKPPAAPFVLNFTSTSP
jgi:hypothetical protein